MDSDQKTTAKSCAEYSDSADLPLDSRLAYTEYGRSRKEPSPLGSRSTYD